MEEEESREAVTEKERESYIFIRRGGPRFIGARERRLVGRSDVGRCSRVRKRRRDYYY